jgi:hypothetical protein
MILRNSLLGTEYRKHRSWLWRHGQRDSSRLPHLHQALVALGLPYGLDFRTVWM